MTTAVEPRAVQPTAGDPGVRRFTRDEYYRMAEARLFEEERVELIAGEVLRMCPQNDRDATTIALLTGLLTRRLPDEFIVRVQLPLWISDESEPEPDVAIVKGKLGRMEGDHPRTAALVIEVADSSRGRDRRKASLYASARVAEYWILLLKKRELMVFRDPREDSEAEFGYSYGEERTLSAGEEVAALAVPLRPIRVSQLLPEMVT